MDRKYTGVGSGMVSSSRAATHSGPTGGVRAMMLKELAKSARSQPAGPGETPE